MSETTNLSLPLLQPSQAQKHVTVNEALVKLDGLTQMSLKSRNLTQPPTVVVDGECYAVPTGATDGWAGQDGQIAIANNGGWVFVTPQDGWNAWVEDEVLRVTCSNGQWLAGIFGTSSNGATSYFTVSKAEYDISAGGAQNVGLEVPENAVVFACSARIVEEITGDMSSWTLDLEDGSITFGTGMGLQAGSYCTGILSQPTAIYAQKTVRISPVGGSFSGGKLRLAVHFYSISLPV